MQVIAKKPRATQYDVHVGALLRAQRIQLGMSQESVAEKLDVTFQQIQKYEKGLNRVSVATLSKFAGIYGDHLWDMVRRLEEAPKDTKNQGRIRVMMSSFYQLPLRQQNSVMELVRSLSGEAA